MKDWTDVPLAFVLGILVGIGVMTFACCAIQGEWQRDSIDRGFARYNETTGAWEWKEQPKESEGAK